MWVGCGCGGTGWVGRGIIGGVGHCVAAVVYSYTYSALRPLFRLSLCCRAVWLETTVVYHVCRAQYMYGNCAVTVLSLCCNCNSPVTVL